MDITISDGEMLTTTKHGKTVGVIYYRDLQGRSKKAITKNCPQAWKKKRDQIRDMLVSGRAGASKISLEAVAAQALRERQKLIGKRNGLRQQTYGNDERHVRLHIVPRIGDKQMARLSVADVNLFIQDMRVREIAPKTQREIVHTLSMICKYAVNSGILQTNPCTKGDRQAIKGNDGARDGYHADEVKSILAATTRHYTKALIHVAAFTGLAANELQGLLWDCVDLKAGKIYVKRTGYRGALIDETKTPYRVRELPLDSTTMRILREWKLQADSDYFVFPSATGVMGDQKHWSGLLETICRHAKVEFKGIGGFRKFYHTQQLLAGVPENIRKYRMGHSKKSQTAMVHYTVTDLSLAHHPADIEKIVQAVST